ncbi:UNVERIFIED_CONTAM: hypothetical protein FKN15_015225 [Acipenser sinensis]
MSTVRTEILKYQGLCVHRGTEAPGGSYATVPILTAWSHTWSARSMHQGDTRAKAAAGELKADSRNTVEEKGENTLLFVYKARLTEVGGLHNQRGLLYSGMKQQSPVEEYTAGWLSNNRSAAIHSTTLNRAVQSDKRQGMRSSSQQQAHSSCQTVAGGITRQRGCGKA